MKDYIIQALINAGTSMALLLGYHFFVAKKAFLTSDLGALEFQRDVNLRGARALYKQALKRELEELAKKASLGDIRKKEEREEEIHMYKEE